jgi:hypothetical protein
MAISVSQKALPKDYTYTPASERGEDKPFMVTFEALPLETVATLTDEAVLVNPSGSYQLNIQSQTLNILKLALKDWQGVYDGKKVVKFRVVHGVAAEENIMMIPEGYRTEIAMVVLGVSKNPYDAESILENGVEDEVDDSEQAE